MLSQLYAGHLSVVSLNPFFFYLLLQMRKQRLWHAKVLILGHVASKGQNEDFDPGLIRKSTFFLPKVHSLSVF